jgi:hypothetical protein
LPLTNSDERDQRDFGKLLKDLPDRIIRKGPPNHKSTNTAKHWEYGVTVWVKIKKSPNSTFIRSFLCNECTKDDVCFTTTAGTSDYIHVHLANEHNIVIPPKKPKTAASKSSSSNVLPSAVRSYDEVKRDTAIWIAVDHKPYAAIETSSYKKLIRSHCPNDPIIRSADTAKNWVIDLYVEQKEEVRKLLERAGENKICLLHDGWKARNRISFLGIHITFVDEHGETKTILLGMRQVKSGTGSSIAKAIKDTLEDFDIDINRIGLCMGDNVAANERALVYLFGENWRDYQGRCAAHIINLVVKELLKPFNKLIRKRGNGDEAGEAGEMDDGDDCEDDCDCCGGGDGDDIEEGNDEMGIVAEIGCFGPAAKIRLVARYLSRCDRGLKLWEEKYGKDRGRLPRDIVTRWNSALKMLRAALVKFRDGWNDFLVCYSIHEPNKKKRQALRSAYMSDDEWSLLEDLVRILEVFERDSRYVQCTEHPIC